LAPLRVWRRNDEWQSADGSLTSSHDEYGNLRREYLLDPELYNDDGTTKAEYLEPGCIEANDLNLTAARYKPLEISAQKVGSPAEIIAELQSLKPESNRGLSGCWQW
jgi:type I restriction enzyme M protein